MVVEKVDDEPHMSHMDQHIKDRRKVGCLKEGSCTLLDKYKIFESQRPHLFNHQFPNYENKDPSRIHKINLAESDLILQPKRLANLSPAYTNLFRN